jgi:hypothetical protein
MSHVPTLSQSLCLGRWETLIDLSQAKAPPGAEVGSIHCNLLIASNI